MELLARSWGTSSHDTLQVIPDFVVQPDGSRTLHFPVSGVRHVDESKPERAGDRIAKLKHGQRLEFRDEPDNPKNHRAIILEAGRKPVGWVPDYLLDEVHKIRQSGNEVVVTVEQANGPETPWHLRLLCELRVGPDPSGT